MNKRLRILTSALLLSGSLLSMVPAGAATITGHETNKASKKIGSVSVTKPNTDISVKSNDPVNIYGTNVRLRKEPNFGSEVLELLNPEDSDKCRYIDWSGKWMHIGYHSPDGWIYGYIYIDN
ncbi:hypothetical protein [Clostridium beijerinckii]|uniref:hypothetical protein n=1 Tax=Clostridium beijerinckii TaxID=1520 RepID=UPI00232EB64B|nr:hypothetical protein [Clostridium beijerinckii]